MAAFSLQIHGNPRVKNLLMSTSVPFSYKTMKITMSQKNQPSNYCDSIRAEIEAHLKQVIPLKPPLSVFEPMHHLTFSAPAHPGPALCVAACELFDAPRSQAMAAAAALYLMHAATFAHEHLPLAQRPKPGPSAHHMYGPNIELLIPDAMVPFAFELLATSGDLDQNGSGPVLRVMVEMTRVVGSQGVIDALYQEMVVGQSDDDTWIDDTCRKKEGALHACAAACGAILGGAKEEEIEKLRNYGLYVGMIQGYSTRNIVTKGKKLERVGELRNLALKELEHFKGRKVEAISSFIIGP